MVGESRDNNAEANSGLRNTGDAAGESQKHAGRVDGPQGPRITTAGFKREYDVSATVMDHVQCTYMDGQEKYIQWGNDLYFFKDTFRRLLCRKRCGRVGR